MSLKNECFTPCSRWYLISLVKKLENCVCCESCKYYQKLTMIKNELEKNGFYTYDSDVVCWKLFESCSAFAVVLCIGNSAVSPQKNSGKYCLPAKKKVKENGK